MDLMDMPVTLIVKAPNQQVEDLTIECELNWSISKLKGYLSEVYPNKPRSEDQKLIYSGKLLNDNIILKDILRKYEGQEIHTMHLVCSPPKDLQYKKITSTKTEKTQPLKELNNINSNNTTTASSSSTLEPSSSSSSSILENMNDIRRRNITSDPTTTQPTATSTTSTTYSTANIPTNTTNSFSQFQQDNLTTQQMAWMRAYSQYMTQYVQLLNSGNQYYTLGSWPMNAMQPPTIPHPTQNQTNNEQPELINNNPPAIDADDDDGRPGRRDWLDWFYILSRVMVLTSIVYFYSSPTRFFLVSTLGLMMYLYQIGFFRPPQLENPQQQQQQRAGPQEEEAPIDQQQQQQQPQQQQQQEPATTESTTAVAPEQDRPSLLALTWTFFSSFFASLIPEQPGAI